MVARKSKPSIEKIVLAGLLAWVLPGLGHVWVGQRRRGLILMIVIALTFWGGVAVGGVQSTVQPRARKAWFLAQICAGSHTLATYTWGRIRAKEHPDERAGQLAEEVAIIYTGVVGMLSILVILDAMASADPNYVRTVAYAPPPKRGTA